MNLRKTALSAMLIASAVSLPSSQASAGTLLNWYFDADGNNATGTVDQINEFFDLIGSAIVHTNDIGTDPNRTFTESGVFNFTAHDTGVPFSSFNNGVGEITAVFKASGNVVLGGNATFTGGTLALYSDTLSGGTTKFGLNDSDDALKNTTYYGANDGTQIALFNVLFGNVDDLNPDGSPTNNSNVEVTFSVANMLAGYFFGPDGTTDLSASDLSVLFGFATTDATAPLSVNAELQQELEDLDGVARGSYSFAPPQQFIISNNGQYRLATIPEPSTILLMGIGLLSFGMRYRKA